MLKKTKSIGYAYPTSTNAGILGFAQTGCYHISETIYRDDGTAKTYLPHDAEGFSEPDHPDLIALYNETEAEHCRHFLAHGDHAALIALGICCHYCGGKGYNASSIGQTHYKTPCVHCEGLWFDPDLGDTGVTPPKPQQYDGVLQSALDSGRLIIIEG